MNLKLADYINSRQLARTNLLYLTKEVLQYQDVDEAVHGPIIEKLQKFRGGHDYFEGNGLREYVPSISCWNLPGIRRRLFLDPRGHLKTTIITISHSIQWIINYPDIRILGSTAIGDQVKKITEEIEAHFRYNERFRFLFPEFCPNARRVSEWGTQESFTAPCRKRRWMKEPTWSCCSVGKVIAGGHYEVIKHSDLVDKENVKTPLQIQDVKNHYGYMNPLLERGPQGQGSGWVDVEGTRYDFSDVYGSIIDQNEKRKVFQISKRAIETNGVPLWPLRFPIEEIDRIKNEPGMTLSMVSAQYYNEPLPDKSGLATEKEIQWIPWKLVREMLPKLRIHTTVDLAGMEDNQGNDSTVLTTAGFDRDARCIIIDIRKGQFTPFEVIEHVFSIAQRYRPIDFKIEKDAHARVLLPFLKRAMEKRRLWPLIIPIRRDSRMSKKSRIMGLQPWFKAGVIRFSEDIPCKLDLVLEITRFPKYIHDDILDTLADQMQNRDGGVSYDLIPREAAMGIPSPKPADRFLGFDPITKMERWLLDSQGDTEENYDRMTGF